MHKSTTTQDLLDDYHDGRLSRRAFVAGALKLGFSAAGAAGLLSACHSKRNTAKPQPLTGRVQILVGFDGGNSATERQVQQALAQAFIGEHSQVGIDFLRATSAPAAEAQLRALIARGSSPDIVLGAGLTDLSRLVDQKVWLDLRPLLRRDGVSTGAFQPPAITAAALAGYYGATKAFPGVPVGMNDHALAYNVDLFSKAGLPLPPASWSDSSWTLTGSFLQAAQALTVDAGGKHPGQAGFDPNQIAQFGVARIRPEAVFFSFGGHLYDPAQRQAQFDRPAAIAGAQFAGDLVSKYHVQPTTAQLAKLAGATPAATPDQAAWRAGKLAMIDLCSCELASPFTSQLPFAWKAAALPAGPARRFGFLDVTVGAIVAASTNHDLAWEVLKYFAIDPARERQLAVGGFGAIPALIANLDAYTKGLSQAKGVDPTAWVTGLPSASAENDGWIPAFADVHTLMADAFGQVQGGAGAAAVMAQLQQQAQAKIDAWFRTNKLPS